MKEKLDDRTEYIYNHYVPKFYLSYFTLDDKPSIIYVTDLSRNKTYLCNIANIGGEKYLNTEEYEKILGRKYENKYTETLRKIQTIDTAAKSNRQLPPGYMDDYFEFVAFIYSHNLYNRQSIAKEVSKSISENPNVGFNEIDFRCQDIIPKQLFEFWKDEFSKWKLFITYCSEMPLNHITSDSPITLLSISPDYLTFRPLDIIMIKSEVFYNTKV